MNSVQLIGRLTRDPDADQTPGGTPVTTFRLAVDRAGRKGADFVTIKTWDRVAETTAEHLRRGRRVAVQGRLAHEEWVGSDGRRAERLTVVADRVQFLDAPAARTDTSVEDGEAPAEAATSSAEHSQPASCPPPGGPQKAA
jgi:single-strand DNA-binding protein